MVNAVPSATDPFYIPPPKASSVSEQANSSEATQDGRRLSSFFDKEDDFAARAALAGASAAEADPFEPSVTATSMPTLPEEGQADVPKALAEAETRNLNEAEPVDVVGDRECAASKSLEESSTGVVVAGIINGDVESTA